MRLYEITEISDIHNFVRNFFDEHLSVDKVSDLDYSGFSSYFRGVLKSLKREINKLNIVPFDISFIVSTGKGGNVEFLSMDGETVYSALIHVGIRGVSGDELTRFNDRYVTMFTNIVTHELGHVRQVHGQGDRPAADILRSTHNVDFSDSLEYINSTLEREMQAVSAVIEIKQMARETGKTVKDFLIMISKDLPTFLTMIKGRDDLFGVANIFRAIAKYPDSRLKTQVYHRALKTIYKYTYLID